MHKLSGQRILILGLGQTGWSCVRYLQACGATLRVADSRQAPPWLAEMQQTFSRIPFHILENDHALLEGIDMLVVSPGIDLRMPLIVEARQRRLPVVGDVELFAQAVKAPVVAITGSNGKSTVTTLVGEMAAAAGLKVAVGGNIGVPVLDLLDDDVELYVLELSSFQLELTETLTPAAATVLNISADHIDRHETLEHYAAIKTSIFRGDGKAIINADDALAQPILDANRKVCSFRLAVPQADYEYGLLGQGDDLCLARGHEKLIPLSELRIHGLHNAANALAALALGESVDLPMDAMLKALRDFAGLPHRCQWVAECTGVNWYNDSKGTNVGATLAALQGLPGPVVLLAGGQAKGGDFSPWKDVLADKGRAVLLFGEDAEKIAADIGTACDVRIVANLQQAVEQAEELAEVGDSVLFSPGCASFDMFSGYVERGEKYVQAVQELLACSA